MLGIIILVIMALSLISAAVNGTVGQVSAAATGGCQRAVELTLYLAGAMALWGGFMKIAEECGAAKLFARLLSPIVKLLFKDTYNDTAARNAVSLNLTANLLGLGNASTPLGIEAARQLNKAGAKNKKRNTAMLVVLNTASIQLIPATAAALRQLNGSAAPYEILLPVLVTSITAAAMGCAAVSALYIKGEG